MPNHDHAIGVGLLAEQKRKTSSGRQEHSSETGHGPLQLPRHEISWGGAVRLSSAHCMQAEALELSCYAPWQDEWRVTLRSNEKMQCRGRKAEVCRLAQSSSETGGWGSGAGDSREKLEKLEEVVRAYIAACAARVMLACYGVCRRRVKRAQPSGLQLERG